MTRGEFFERLATQALLAACASFFLALALEVVMPLSVSPFIDLPDVGLLLLILTSFWILWGSGPSTTFGHISRGFERALLLFLFVVGFGLLWLWMSPNRLSEFALLGCATLLAALVFVVAFRGE